MAAAIKNNVDDSKNSALSPRLKGRGMSTASPLYMSALVFELNRPFARQCQENGALIDTGDCRERKRHPMSQRNNLWKMSL